MTLSGAASKLANTLKNLLYRLRVLRAHKMPMTHGRVFSLWRGDDVLGKIVLRAELCDFPWYGGEFKAEPAFASIEPLFREEIKLLHEGAMDAWGEVWRQIDRIPLALVPADGGAAQSDPVIHIEDGVARWRA